MFRRAETDTPPAIYDLRELSVAGREPARIAAFFATLLGYLISGLPKQPPGGSLLICGRKYQPVGRILALGPDHVKIAGS